MSHDDKDTSRSDAVQLYCWLDIKTTECLLYGIWNNVSQSTWRHSCLVFNWREGLAVVCTKQKQHLYPLREAYAWTVPVLETTKTCKHSIETKECLNQLLEEDVWRGSYGLELFKAEEGVLFSHWAGTKINPSFNTQHLTEIRVLLCHFKESHPIFSSAHTACIYKNKMIHEQLSIIYVICCWWQRKSITQQINKCSF